MMIDSEICGPDRRTAQRPETRGVSGAATALRASAATVAPVHVTELQRPAILIIDDHPDTIRMLSAIVQGDADTLFATNGAAGLAMARARQPLLVLLDVEMAGMDGYEVCRRLKADPACADIAVIFVTAHHSMESEVRALEAGAVDFITKPLNPPVVLARVRTHLRLQRHGMALDQLARRDSLTGLFNRRHFLEVAEIELARLRRQDLPLALAFIDIDYFKLYNDGYGHQAGDSCLIDVARELAGAARRPGECVARFGGEEFVALLPYCNSSQALDFGAWCCSRISRRGLPHRYQPSGETVSISIGLTALVPQESTSVASLLAAADSALYLAKQAGRNRAVFSLPE
ncbi:MAG: diguanylate cyclase [Telluria sp.]